MGYAEDNLFPKNETVMIQEIPFGRSAAEDVLVWNNKENGCYSVRSGYRILTGYHERENANQNEKEIKFWKKI